VFPSENISGAQSILYKQPKKYLVLWLARGFPDPFEDWMCTNSAHQLFISFSGSENIAAPDVFPDIKTYSLLLILNALLEVLKLVVGFHREGQVEKGEGGVTSQNTCQGNAWFFLQKRTTLGSSV
jgi:hypothetical protein